MAKVDPLPKLEIPANPTNADLAKTFALAYEMLGKGQTQLHSCLEEHRSVSRKGNITVQNQIRSTNREIKKAATKVAELTNDVSIVKDKVVSVTNDVSEIKQFAKDINKNGWRAVAAVVMAIFVAGLGVAANSMFLHESTATKAEVSQKTANRYTSEDAAKDQANLNARLDKLQESMKK